jgi:predicted enzyme related to lactoylglutathione lyase
MPFHPRCDRRVSLHSAIKSHQVSIHVAPLSASDNGNPALLTRQTPRQKSCAQFTAQYQIRLRMPKVNYFAIPADLPERAINFYRQVFGWKFEPGWQYDTPHGREKYWHIITGDGASSINGGLTKREYPGQPISIGIEVPSVDVCTNLVEKSGGRTLVAKVAIPGVAWFAVCQDSEGNSIPIFQPDPAA